MEKGSGFWFLLAYSVSSTVLSDHPENFKISSINRPTTTAADPTTLLHFSFRENVTDYNLIRPVSEEGGGEEEGGREGEIATQLGDISRRKYYSFPTLLQRVTGSIGEGGRQKGFLEREDNFPRG